MKVFQAVLGAIGFAALSNASVVAAQDDTSIEALPIEFSEDGFSGPGADRLRDGLDLTQFVMIGEAHGHAGAPLLVSAFAAETQQFGFDHYAVEVGPYSAQWVANSLRTSGIDGFAGELTGRPLAVPFLNSRGEARAASAFLSPGALWGVDQEFIGSPLIHLEILQGMDPADPEMLAQMAQAEREAFSAGNQGAVLFAAATDETWQRLRASFAGNGAALDRIAAMERSAGIYRSFMTGRGLDNNLDRVELIREYFLESYRAASETGGTLPRVIMKFGAVHAGRSTSAMSTFDLGSLIEGMAAANGMEALHVAYIPIGGTQKSVRPSAEGAFRDSPVKADDLRALLSENGVDVAAIDASDGHFVIDLDQIKRRLGNRGLSDLDPMARFVVLGFDYLITTSSAQAAVPLAER